MTLPDALIECRQVACERDGRILFEQLDFVVNPGDIVHIEGPNGCGKTTLLRVLTTLLSDYRGEIVWRGKPIDKVRTEFLASLLFIGHVPGVKKTLTPRENLLFLSRLHQHVDITQIDKALEKVGLYGYEDMPGHQLSAGQLRRVALARLYMSQERIWVLDEPYTAIDKQGIEHLEQQLISHANAGGCVILTTHQPPAIDTLKRIALHEYAPSHHPVGADSA